MITANNSPNNVDNPIFTNTPVNPYLEMGAYEYLWSQTGATFKRISELFSEFPDLLPTELVEPDVARSYAEKVQKVFESSGIHNFGVRLYGTSQYPMSLRDATHPIELIYYIGTWELADTNKSVAIVGSRRASDDGIRRARKLAAMLAKEGFTIVSGLAEGIDTAAHEGALSVGGKTIAVIGTPISHFYPPSNKELQKLISSEHLLISQVPVLKYLSQDYRHNRNFFPERNKTMSALTKATIIVEAGETSGTLTQARAAIAQGRKLFILDSCFKNKNITWPSYYESKGAYRVKDIEQITEVLKLD